MEGDESRLEALRKAHILEAGRRGRRSTRVEDYLEVIHELLEDRGEARLSDIGEHLSVARPTVTKMIQRMFADGLVHYERYRPVTLTEQGRALALAFRERHGVLVKFLTLLGVDEERAHLETEGIEHHLDEQTVSRIAELVARAEQNPDWWADG